MDKILASDLDYYKGDTIWCKDGLKSFPREHLNDNFCDCADGTDEPGKSLSLMTSYQCMHKCIKFAIVSSVIAGDPSEIFCAAGTSACPNGKFYCKNLGSDPQVVYSSRVNDGICGQVLSALASLLCYSRENRIY